MGRPQLGQGERIVLDDHATHGRPVRVDWSSEKERALALANLDGLREQRREPKGRGPGRFVLRDPVAGGKATNPHDARVDPGPVDDVVILGPKRSLEVLDLCWGTQLDERP